MPRTDPPENIDWSSHFQALALTSIEPQLQLFYQQGCIASDTPLAEVPFVAVDFETTGLDAEHDEIISIGLVPFDLSRIRIREARHWLLKPRQKLASESVVIHGITHSDINDAPDLEEVLGSVLEAIAGRIPVVHYRYIERSFLDAALKRRVNEGIQFPVVDTMDLEARMHRQGFARKLSRFLGRKPVSIRLSDSRVRYSLPRYSQHHALTDAIATAELLQAQIRYHYSEDSPISELWC